jgi:hypothetical protein
MEIPIVVLIAGGGAFVGLFVAALLLVRSEGDHRANLVLAALMVLLSLSILYPLIFPALPSLSRTHAVLILEPFLFLIAPLMGLFFRVLLVPEYRLRAVQLLHRLPFALFGLMSLVPIPSSGPAPGHLSASRVTEVLWALLVVQASPFAYGMRAFCRLLCAAPGGPYCTAIRDKRADDETAADGLGSGYACAIPERVGFGIRAPGGRGLRLAHRRRACGEDRKGCSRKRAVGPCRVGQATAIQGLRRIIPHVQ